MDTIYCFYIVQLLWTCWNEEKVFSKKKKNGSAGHYEGGNEKIVDPNAYLYNCQFSTEEGSKIGELIKPYRETLTHLIHAPLRNVTANNK